MKKMLLITILAALIVNTSEAQKDIKPDKAKDSSQLKTKVAVQSPIKVIKTQPAQTRTIPPPPPLPSPPITPPVQNQPPQPSNMLYWLKSVRVNIRTGADNKESPSIVSIHLMSMGGKVELYQKRNITSEFRSNSNTEIVLDNLYSSFQSTYTRDEGRLHYIQQGGLVLQIHYDPNFIMDAWKIEGVSVTLEFQDANLVRHSIYGIKVIEFLDASLLMVNRSVLLSCPIDKFFMPKPVSTLRDK